MEQEDGGSHREGLRSPWPRDLVVMPVLEGLAGVTVFKQDIWKWSTYLVKCQIHSQVIETKLPMLMTWPIRYLGWDSTPPSIEWSFNPWFKKKKIISPPASSSFCFHCPSTDLLHLLPCPCNQLFCYRLGAATRVILSNTQPHYQMPSQGLRWVGTLVN